MTIPVRGRHINSYSECAWIITEGSDQEIDGISSSDWWLVTLGPLVGELGWYLPFWRGSVTILLSYLRFKTRFLLFDDNRHCWICWLICGKWWYSRKNSRAEYKTQSFQSLKKLCYSGKRWKKRPCCKGNKVYQEAASRFSICWTINNQQVTHLRPMNSFLTSIIKKGTLSADQEIHKTRYITCLWINQTRFGKVSTESPIQSGIMWDHPYNLDSWMLQPKQSDVN